MKIVTEEEARKSILEEKEKHIDSGFENSKYTSDKSFQKVSRKSSVLQLLLDIKDIFLMLKDYCTGKYREVPFWIIISIAGALIYIINPFDLVADVIPIIGLIDDVIVLLLCLTLIRMDLVKYRKWKNRKL
jgi:uncharacterized membrane protein YkvA (DUF1232 family)